LIRCNRNLADNISAGLLLEHRAAHLELYHIMSAHGTLAIVGTV
jgi:hypothetical protein